MAPAPPPVAGPPPLPKASDALALTNSSLNQLQVFGLASPWGCLFCYAGMLQKATVYSDVHV